jgi:hypothetical protein
MYGYSTAVATTAKKNMFGYRSVCSFELATPRVICDRGTGGTVRVHVLATARYSYSYSYSFHRSELMYSAHVDGELAQPLDAE